jgi:hypothetical protein
MEYKLVSALLKLAKEGELKLDLHKSKIPDLFKVVIKDIANSFECEDIDASLATSTLQQHIHYYKRGRNKQDRFSPILLWMFGFQEQKFNETRDNVQAFYSSLEKSKSKRNRFAAPTRKYIDKIARSVLDSILTTYVIPYIEDQASMSSKPIPISKEVIQNACREKSASQLDGNIIFQLAVAINHEERGSTNESLLFGKIDVGLIPSHRLCEYVLSLPSMTKLRPAPEKLNPELNIKDCVANRRG